MTKIIEKVAEQVTTLAKQQTEVVVNTAVGISSSRGKLDQYR